MHLVLVLYSFIVVEFEHVCAFATSLTLRWHMHLEVGMRQTSKFPPYILTTEKLETVQPQIPKMSPINDVP